MELRYMCAAESQRPAGDQSAGTTDATAHDPLRVFLLKLAEAPEMRDRLIFDPVGLMFEADLTPDDQELVLSGDVEAINARVWPEGDAPRNGPLLQIDVVASQDGQMPIVRAAYSCLIVTNQPQAVMSPAQHRARTTGIVGSVAMAHSPPLVVFRSGPSEGT